MAYEHDLNTSYSRLRRYASQVVGGLRARAALAGEVPGWTAMSERITAERAARELADDALLGAAARVRVADADFDVDIGGTSGQAFLLSGKKADQEPYRTLFGKIDARRAKSLGAAKATEVGQRVVRDGRRLELPALAEPLVKLEASTAALQAAGDAYTAADDGLFGPRQAKWKLVRDLNTLIAVTEARILTAFPGRDDLTRAILRPWYERKSGAGPSGDATDAPSIPAPDLEDEDEPTEA